MLVKRIAAIRRWHWGKIVILWAWGGLFVGLFLTAFLSQAATIDPASSLLSFLASLAILAALTAITWLWLGGKDSRRPRQDD